MRRQRRGEADFGGIKKENCRSLFSLRKRGLESKDSEVLRLELLSGLENPGQNRAWWKHREGRISTKGAS